MYVETPKGSTKKQQQRKNQIDSHVNQPITHTQHTQNTF